MLRRLGLALALIGLFVLAFLWIANDGPYSLHALKHSDTQITSETIENEAKNIRKHSLIPSELPTQVSSNSKKVPDAVDSNREGENEAVQVSLANTEEGYSGAIYPEAHGLINGSHPTYRSFVEAPSVEMIEAWDADKNQLQRHRRVYVEDNQFPHLLIKETISRRDDGSAEISDRIIVVADHFVVMFKDGVPEVRIKDLADSLGLTIRKKHLVANTYSLALQDDFSLATRDSIQQTIDRSDLVDVVQDDSLFFTSVTPNDPMLSQQWALVNPTANLDLKMRTVWDQNTDCSKAMVAIVDTGIDLDHPDLINNLADSSLHRSFVNGENTADDGAGHGTHVAGIVAAEGNNGQGVSGVCWKGKLVAIKVLGANGSGTNSGVADGFQYASTIAEVKVVNASLGGRGGADAMLTNAVAALGRAGKILAVAAGNDNVDVDANPKTYPAALPGDHILRVAAHGINQTLANFSNFGQQVQIAAPGVDILATWHNGRCPTSQQNSLYCTISGTSMAAPFMAGILAQYWSQHTKAKNTEVIGAVLKHAESINLGGRILQDKRVTPLPTMIDAITPSNNLQDLLKGLQYLNGGMSIPLNLAVSPRQAAITKVELFNGQDLVATLTAEPYALVFKVPEDGKVNLRIVMTDENGKSYEAGLGELDVNPSPSLEDGIGDRKIFYLGEQISVASSDADGLSKLAYKLGSKLKEVGNPGNSNTMVISFEDVGTFDFALSSEDTKGAIKSKEKEIEVRGYDALASVSDALAGIKGSVSCQLKVVFKDKKSQDMHTFSVNSEASCITVCDMVAQYEIGGHQRVQCFANGKMAKEYRFLE